MRTILEGTFTDVKTTRKGKRGTKVRTILECTFSNLHIINACAKLKCSREVLTSIKSIIVYHNIFGREIKIGMQVDTVLEGFGSNCSQGDGRNERIQ